MKNEEIVKALRCVSTAGGENACEHCSYWKEEEVPEEERPIYGADTWHSCDVDRVGLDGADLIERLTDRCARYTEEIAELQDVLCKFLRGRVDGDTLANITEEIADVGIMLDQMAIDFEVEDAVAEQRAHKVRRLRERMENDA